MSRRIPALLRRGGRGGVAPVGGAAAPLVATDVVGLSGFSASNYVGSASATDLQATTAQTLVVFFRVDALPTIERIFSKGSASTTGWSFYMIDQELFVKFWGNVLSLDMTTVEADCVGKTFCAVGTIDGSGMNLWLGSLSPNLAPSLRGTTRLPLEDLTVTAAATTTLPFAIGAQRGDTGTQYAPNLTIVGCGFGETKVTASQAAEIMRNCSSLGYVPTDFVGATHVYNAATGLGTDQVGSANATIKGTLTTEAEFTPDFPGLVHAGVMMIGQSNAVAPVTVSNFTASLLTAYPSVRQYFGTAWTDLDDRGDNATASEIKFMRDLDVAGFIGDAEDARIAKRASSGTGFTTGDWGPTDGLYLAAVGVWDDAQAALVDPLDMMELRIVVWIQGEADAQGAVPSAAYQAEENAMFDAMLVDYIGAGTHTRFVDCLLPAFQTGLTHRAEVNAAKLANAAARSDVLIVYTDNLADRGDLTHYNEPSHESLGGGISTAILTDADATAATP